MGDASPDQAAALTPGFRQSPPGLQALVQVADRSHVRVELDACWVQLANLNQYRAGCRHGEPWSCLSAVLAGLEMFV